MFENMDGRRTGAGVTGILLADPWAFGSSELIIIFKDGVVIFSIENRFTDVLNSAWAWSLDLIHTGTKEIDSPHQSNPPL